MYMRPDAEAIFSFFACLLPNVEYAIGSELFNNFETIVYLWVWRPIDHLVLSMSDPGCQKNDKAGQDTLWPNFANLQKAPQNLHFVHETQNCVFCLSNICTGFPPGRARLAGHAAKPWFLRDPSKTQFVQKMAKLRKTSTETFNFSHQFQLPS